MRDKSCVPSRRGDERGTDAAKRRPAANHSLFLCKGNLNEKLKQQYSVVGNQGQDPRSFESNEFYIRFIQPLPSGLWKGKGKKRKGRRMHFSSPPFQLTASCQRWNLFSRHPTISSSFLNSFGETSLVPRGGGGVLILGSCCNCHHNTTQFNPKLS